MFGLDPLSRPVALGEILLLLAFAGLVGWLLGRLMLTGRVRRLRADIADAEAELDKCRHAKPGVMSEQDASLPPARTAPYPDLVTEPVAAFVSADPLLPAFSHDDTPDPIAADVARAFDPSDAAVDDPYNHHNESLNSPTVSTTRLVESRNTDTLMTGNSEAAVLNRIAARAGEVNFDRIGRATAAEADDLKDIIGIGPFLERKLHSLGIYTFRQVANFTKEDVDKINSIIEFFPGRIERDNWVDQSQAFHERKYGARS